jgi:hypothetical protein
MSKSVIYISLIKKLVPLELSNPVLKDPLFRGNVAYFIEEYYSSEEWDDILRKVNSLIKENNVNELCGFLLSKIYAKCSISSSLCTNKDFMELTCSISKELYEKGKLRHLALVCPDDFPDWIYEADYVLTS